MALSLKQAIEEIRHELGGKTDRRLPELEIVNRAGEHLCSLRTWRFLKRDSALLNVVANQGFVELPEDLVSLSSIAISDGSQFGVQQVTVAELMDLRSWGGFPSIGTVYVAMTHIDAQSEVGHEPKPVLLISPTPTTSQAGYFTISYEGGWRRVHALGDAEMIAGKNGRIPDWCGALFVDFMRAFAAGYERSTVASVSQRLAEVQGGPLYAAAVTRDIKLARTLGVHASLAALRDRWSDGEALPPV